MIMELVHEEDRVPRNGKKFRKDTKTTNNLGDSSSSSTDNLSHHSGILGLCAFVEAFPYDVPSFLPPILMELSTHLNDPQVKQTQSLSSSPLLRV